MCSRGYYYDTETGFYYLQSRYYDPEVQRFINADGYVSTGTGLNGYNMFAYCGNNPIIRIDFSGERYAHINSNKSNEQLAREFFEKIEREEKYRAGVQLLNRMKEMNRKSYSETEVSDAMQSCSKNAIQTDSSTTFFYLSQPASIGISMSPQIGTTPLRAAGATGFGYLITTPVNIAFHWSNPNLMANQKWALTYMEIGFAAGGILLAYGLANCWNPTGWIAIGVTAAYMVVTTIIVSETTNYYYRRNGFS